jgi:uncharacterized protein (DUF697 family)/GTP-binding protein EngB required for normal cell division
VLADLAAVALAGIGVAPRNDIRLADIEADVIGRFTDRPAPSDFERLVLALARLRLPIEKRARLIGLDVAAEPLFLHGETKHMESPDGTSSTDGIWNMVQEAFGQMPFLKDLFEKVKQEQEKLGKVNILIAGKTGVGKSTLVNAVFGESVAKTGLGRPVTADIKWYEPQGLPVRLCDTQGLELKNFQKILDDLEREIKKGEQSGRAADRVHILWLCILEPGGKIEPGEELLIAMCERYRIPTVVILTKAIGPKAFGAEVRRVMPQAKAIIRVLAEDWDDFEPPVARFGLPDLIRATHDLLPEATRNAFDAVQRVVVAGKRARALNAVATSAAAAALAAATPIPVVDAAAVFSVNVGMIAAVSVIMGVEMSGANIKTLGGSMLGAMAVAGGGRLIAGELLKFIPGIGTIWGGTITSGIAASATYGLGYGYIEFLCRFQSAQQRMPNGDEIADGFRQFWNEWDHKDMALPPADINVHSA